MKFPFVQILTLIFITLKLTGFIGWSWWWVWSPMYLPLLVMLTMVTYVWSKSND